MIAVLFIAMFLPALVLAGEGRAHLEAYLADFNTLQAEFEQTLFDETGVSLEVSKGAVYLQRPSRFRWEYRTPYEQLIVGDGEQIWIYDEDLEQVTVKPMGSTVTDTPVLLLGGDTSIEEEFSVTELGKRGDLTWVGLHSRGEENQYSDIRLGFDGPEMRVMELSDNFGQTTRIVFSLQRRNGPIAPSIFQFVPPAGVDVLDASEDL